MVAMVSILIQQRKMNKFLNFLLLWVTLLSVVLQFGVIYFEVDSSAAEGRQIGKSDFTIYTADVTSAGLEVPDEYSDEVAMIQFSDDEPIEGETITINATVFNVGTRGADLTVYFYDGPIEQNDLIGYDMLSIHAFGYSIASTPWDTTDETEFHTIFVILSPEDPGNETNLTDNNQAIRDIIVNQYPLVDAGVNIDAFEDDVVEFNGYGSDTASDLNTGLQFTWYFNDPYADPSGLDTVSGLNLTQPTYAYKKSGTYIVNLTVQDDGGAAVWDTLVARIVNSEPIAKINISETEFDEDEEIFFNASDSVDTPSDKLNLSYSWSFGDGTKSPWVNVTTTSHSYPYEDTYTATLTVRDDDNLTNSDSVQIKVMNVAPDANAGRDMELFGSTVVFNGSGTTDTISDIENLSYTWTFGDGLTGEGITVIHEYLEKKKYTVTLKVIDDDSESDTDSISVTIRNLSPMPVINLKEITAYEDEEIPFNSSGSYDPDGEITSYVWSVGDNIIAYGPDKALVTHTFTEVGTYSMTLTVEDDNNAVSKAVAIVRIENVAPEAVVSEFIEVYKGEEIEFFGGNSTDTPSDLPFLKYHWDFGDGNYGEGLTVRHKYDEVGIYDAVLTVIDDDSAESRATIRVIIRDILLTAITLIADLEPETAKPGTIVGVTGSASFEFLGTPKDYDLNLPLIRIELMETGEIWRITPDDNGNFDLTFSAPKIEGTYTVKVSITRLGMLTEESLTLTVKSTSVGKKQDKPYYDVTTTIILATVIGSMSGVGAFTVGTDLGRYKYFTLLIPLYTRLNKKAVLDNFTRGRIFEHIRKNPGDHFSTLKKNLEINSGSLSYHLSVLEKEEYIKSRTDGFTKRFYPFGMKITKGQPHNIQELILQKIDEKPAITQKDLANELGLDISTVNYHINIMAGAGIIISEKKGRSKQYYILSEVEQVTDSVYS